MRVAVIGAGAAGLCAAQSLSTLENDTITFVVYEQTGNIGGTWVYTDNTTKDEYGLPVHSSMYKNLRTNLPKETMEYPAFPFKHKKSFIHRTDVLKYLTEFTDHFGLKKLIKFHHHVSSVVPNNSGWDVSVKNLKTNSEETGHFDAVMVCNGHFSDPRYPDFPGMDSFQGIQMHSHQYRTAEIFRGKKVVVIGSGPSGTDISLDIAPAAEKVFISHHNENLRQMDFTNVIHKPDIVSLTEDSVLFDDGTTEEVDVILYCTGYNYTFPFLSDDCGITVDDSYVQPLYMHLFNINHPTMCFIGIPWQSLIIPLFDLQVRSFINVLLGNVELPSKEEMLQDLSADVKYRQENGLKTRFYHRMGLYLKDYLIKLASACQVEPIPDVVAQIFYNTARRRREFLTGYREDLYEIVDAENYIFHENKAL